jgi:hypothetical protein
MTAALSGSYVVSSTVLLNGVPYPATHWSVDVNSYSMASSLEATISLAQAMGFAQLPDFGQLMQQVRPLPFEIHAGLSTDGTGSEYVIETGYVDERETDYLDRTISFTGRGVASIFQDIQVSKPLNRNQAGSAIIQQFFASKGIPLTIASASPAYSGKTGGDPVFNTTMRARTAWDEMQAIALADGYRLTVHAGQGTYGPPSPDDPTLRYAWRGGSDPGTGGGWLANLNVRHSPRKSHNIMVRLTSALSKNHGATRIVRAAYGSSSAQDGEVFNFATSGLSFDQAKQRAQSIWLDLAKREFLVTADIVPDETFMNTVSAYGANFNIKLGGDIPASEQLTYGVRQVKLSMDPGARNRVPMRASVIMGNVNPIQEGADLSS